MRASKESRASGEEHQVLDGRSMTIPHHLFDAYIFDLDGTIYLGDELLPGARRLITQLRAWGKVVRFVSNNPTKDPTMYAEKLTRLGVPTPVEEIINPVMTMTRWLLTTHPNAVVFPISEAPLIRALTEAGIRLSSNPAEVDIVIASYDRSFTYEKLQIAFDAIWFYKRASLVATNPDPYCPLAGGRGEPDAAAVIAAIEACTGTRCKAIIGKPDPLMVRVALEGLNIDLTKCIMVGDRLATDIRMALDAGMASALVLTGEATASDLEHLPAQQQPDFVLERIDQMLSPEIWQQLGW